MKLPFSLRASLCMLALILPLTIVQAADTLIYTGATWKYLDNGSNQGGAWRGPAFNDALWSSSNAEFGYGDGDETTVVSYGGQPNQKHITTYFRKQFTVTNPSAYSNFTLSLLRDDGAVVYLNGIEVLRSNMPTGNINFNTKALTEISGAGETTYVNVTVPTTAFVSGSNLIAVEIHQFSKTGPDISFNLSLTGGAVVCGTPVGSTTYSISATGAVFSWSALTGATSYNLRYKAIASSTWINTSTPNTTMTIYGLSPDVTYEWQAQAVCGLGNGNFTSSTLFNTLPASTIQMFFPGGDVWKYSDQGLNLGTLWRAPGYNDSGWAADTAELGYGDGDETTVVSYGSNANNKYVTTYFRKSFTVSNPSYFSMMTLSIVRDDGAVVYVNGTEVYRSNMPPGPIAYNTLASSSVTDETDWNTSLFSPSLLVAGTNVIAVEIHQHEVTSDDISFNFKLWGSVVPTIKRGPYLQSVTPASIIVRWRTDVASTSRVRAGTFFNAYDRMYYDGTSTTEHSVQLTGLDPETFYYYTIETGTHVLQADTDNYFRTASMADSEEAIRIWAIGDFGIGSNAQNAVRDAYINYTGSTYTNTCLWLGSNAYNSGTDAEYQAKVFDVYQQQLKSIPLYSAVGNNDYANVGYVSSSALTTAFPYFSIMSNPTAGEAGGVPSGTEKYYSFNYANVHFVVLDTYGAFSNPGSPMHNWLVSDLAANSQTWTVIYFHHPPYTKGDYNSDADMELINVRQNLNPVFDDYHVDVVLSGHSHTNERSMLIKGHYGLASTFAWANIIQGGSGAPIDPYVKFDPFDGTVYAVCGTSGQVTSTMQADAPMPCMYFTDNTYNASLVIDVIGHEFYCKYLASDGSIVDEFLILKHPSRPAANNGSNSEPGFNIFPNPAHDKIAITFTGELTFPSWISIYNSIGEIVYEEETLAKSKLLDVSIPAGIYIVKVISGEKIYTRRLIIE
jgi:hypothetical protein